jgi:hypothetical protein
VKLHLWANVFIPRHIPGQTERMRIGPFAGLTYLPSPLPLRGGFLTDNRGFRKAVGSDSRVHARLVIDLERGIVRDWHRCGETIGLHRETGEELCRGRENTDRVHVEDLLVQDTPPLIRFTLRGACSNPCLTLAPSVDFKLDTEITATDGDWRGPIEVAVNGMVEPFPAFEMYVRRAKERTPHTVFRIPVAPDASALSMFGPANRPVEATVTIPSEPNR